MNSGKGFEHKNKLMSKIINLAIRRSNGYLNSAYLLEAYLRIMTEEGYMEYLEADYSKTDKIQVYNVFNSILELENEKIPGFSINYTNCLIDSESYIMPEYIDNVLNELFELDDYTIIYHFGSILKDWKIIDKPLKLLLSKLNTDIEFIDKMDRKSKSITNLNIVDNKQLTLEDTYNIDLGLSNKKENDIKLISEDNEHILERSDYDIDELRPKFLIDMIEELENNTEIILDINNYNTKMLNVICRKKQKSICLVGESGIGKTSTAKNFLKFLVTNGIETDKFENLNVFRIDSTRLICDTCYRGEFEAKVTEMLDYFEDLQLEYDYKCHIILFLDDLANYCNLGTTDKDNNSFMTMILPYLSSGDISLVATCNTSMYHRVIENDTQILNSIQIINMKEPSEQECMMMLEKGKAEYENYHKVKITKSVLKDLIHLSNRYIKLGSLPGKAVKVIDQALAISSINNKEKLSSSDVLEVVSDISEINIKELTKSDKDKLKELDKVLHESIISQDDAIDKVVKAVRRGKLGISNNEKPVASFLFVGPTGVGKTELTKQLHKCIFNSKESMLKLDMSEFSEESSISKLIGSAPGYVGYENGGRLTEHVKHNPQSLILFDEIEKANPKIYNSLLQILDCGKLTDNTGYTVDFRDCIIVMTSNAGYGADGLNKTELGFSSNKLISEIDKKKEIEKKVITALESTFSPEFLNRLDSIVLFNKLTKEDAKLISKLSLNKLKDRLKNQKIEIEFSNELAEFTAEKGYSEKYGARNINREIQDYVEDSIAEFMLNNLINKSKLNILDIELDNIIIRHEQLNKISTNKSKNKSKSTELMKIKSNNKEKITKSKLKTIKNKDNIKVNSNKEIKVN